MSAIKNLFSQTIIYGLSTLLVRMINWILNPFYTYTFKDPSEFGIINNLYAYIAFLNIIYMYGMETGFFRFGTKKEERVSVFKTINAALFTTSTIFTILLVCFSSVIASFLGFEEHPYYVVFFAFILFFDNIVNIPFALLRMEGKPGKFLTYRLLNVGVNVLANLFFFLPVLFKDYHFFEKFGFVHNPDYCVYYVFIANLLASFITFLCFLPVFIKYPLKFDTSVFKPIWKYAAPLIIVGLAGMINEVADREMLKRLLNGTLKENLYQVGVYSAVYKLSIFMTLAIQGFRMGAEPFFFRYAEDKNAPALYAKVLTYFALTCIFIFLGVNLFSNIIINLLEVRFRTAIHILPILLFANLCLGLYYNISAWYRIKDKTIYGTYITVAGALITLVANFVLIPMFGYTGAAITHAITYFFMMVTCYIIGQKYFPVPYQWGKIFVYFVLACIFIYINKFIGTTSNDNLSSIFVALILTIFYLLLVWFFEFRKLKIQLN